MNVFSPIGIAVKLKAWNIDQLKRERKIILISHPWKCHIFWNWNKNLNRFNENNFFLAYLSPFQSSKRRIEIKDLIMNMVILESAISFRTQIEFKSFRWKSVSFQPNNHHPSTQIRRSCTKIHYWVQPLKNEMISGWLFNLIHSEFHLFIPSSLHNLCQI